MPDYNQQTGQYTKWVRCKFIGINNPRPILGSSPSVTFAEEEVTLKDGEESQIPLGNLIEPFNAGNAGEAFDLIHPETGAVIGSMTYQELYVAMASAYLHVATKRDQALSAPTAPPAE
jgi:hypothetical protein